ncbi:MAG: hypothetical protein LBF34_01020 [Puniceicoccales bacterium]|nr:hypothetical protein [Puniceicoccales bacterium]
MGNEKGNRVVSGTISSRNFREKFSWHTMELGTRAKRFVAKIQSNRYFLM